MNSIRESVLTGNLIFSNKYSQLFHYQFAQDLSELKGQSVVQAVFSDTGPLSMKCFVSVCSHHSPRVMLY